MQKSETYFEQIPVQKVKALLFALPGKQSLSQIPGRLQLVLNCRICHQAVPLETAKTDGDGQAIHEACYLSRVMQETAASGKRPAGRSS